jgi:uncharacterized protein (TIGR02453 family)
MSAPLTLRPTLNFLDDLGKHNTKAWFDTHRAAYEEARDLFAQFIDHLIDALRVSDQLQGLSAKDCIARINRDTRFAKDKSPYKTNLSAAIAPGGRKSEQLGYHIAVGPHGQSLIAGGLYMPTAEQLAKFRQAIDQDATALKRIANDTAFTHAFGTIEGEKLATAPQGFSRTHPEIELLKLKQVVVVHHVADTDVLAPDFLEQAVNLCKAMKPFLDYLNRVLQ